MMKKIDELLLSYQQEMVETLQKWVRIPSVKGEAIPGAPFGAENRKALECAMADCEKMGFATEIFDGYAGHADLGEGDDYDALGILAHLDVVPVGDGWTVEPFGGEVRDGKIFGRGTSDDKGPAVAAMYAMRAVKEAGVPLKRKVRLILGCDEECGSSDMAYYKEHAVMPRSGFSPDAEYPVINIEKGGCNLMIRGRQAGLKVLEMNVGERPNVVPGFAAALVEGDEELLKKVQEEAWPWPVKAKMEMGAVRIETIGVTGHAAMPEHGRNAIGQLMLVLKKLGAKGIVETLADKIGMTCYAENLGIAMEDKVSGKLTCSMDIIRTEGDTVSAVMDIRYPVLFNLDAALALLQSGLSDCEVVNIHSRAPHFVSEDTQLVKELLEAYHEVTGLEKKAIAIGGGTYAQSMEEGVAFGALFPGEVEMAHQADEYLELKSMFESARIFARAIVRLAGK
ncbi:MAG: dipeptidase PepV [Clostridia bacterium]|nr:dipeptidase PepV [Clostridia bacterium]